MERKNPFVEKVSWKHIFSFEFIFLMFLALLFNTLYYPIENFFKPSSKRFKELSQLRMPELAKAIVENGDYERGNVNKVKWRTGLESKTGLYEYEQQIISKHLSTAGTDDAYINDVLKVAKFDMFWVTRNGYEVNTAQKTFFWAFWLGVIITCFVFWIF